jgi:hypothetical protein
MTRQGVRMRDLPHDIDADAVIAIGYYLDAHGWSTPVAISIAIPAVRRRVETALSDQSLQELIVEMCSSRRLAVLFDAGKLQSKIKIGNEAQEARGSGQAAPAGDGPPVATFPTT